MGLRSYSTEPQVWGGDDPACAHDFVPYGRVRVMQPQRDNSGGLVNNRINSRGKQKWTAGASMKPGAFPVKTGAAVAVHDGGEATARRDVEHNGETSPLCKTGGVQIEPAKECHEVGGEPFTSGCERSTTGAVDGSVSVQDPTNEVPNVRVWDGGQSSGQALSGQDAVPTKDVNQRLAPKVPAVGDVAEFGPLFGDRRLGGDKSADELGAARVHADETDRTVFSYVAVGQHQSQEVGEIGAPRIETFPPDHVPQLSPDEIGGMGRPGAGAGTESSIPLSTVPGGTEERLAALLADDFDAGVLTGNGATPTYPDAGRSDVEGLAAGVANDGRHASMICEKCGAVKCELGQEPTIALFISHLVSVFEAVKRVLRDDGCLFCNLGDSFSTGGQGIPAKNLMLIPFRFAIAMQEAGWYVRQDIIWSKAAPMPESVTDRCTRSHEYIFMFTKSARYFCDMEAVKEAPQGYDRKGGDAAWSAESGHTNGVGSKTFHQMAPGGRNLRSVWHLSPSPYPAAHFATFVPEVPRRCILMGSSERGACPACGAPWRRTVEPQGEVQSFGRGDLVVGKQREWKRSSHVGPNDNGGYRPPKTTGWAPSCSCPPAEPVPCVCLDIFAGAGTTGLVAEELGRDSVLVELNSDYAAMAKARIEAACPLFTRVEVE